MQADILAICRGLRGQTDCSVKWSVNHMSVNDDTERLHLLSLLNVYVFTETIIAAS